MQTIILPTLRPPILRVLHEAHPGIARMKAMARSHVGGQELTATSRILCVNSSSVTEPEKLPQLHHCFLGLSPPLCGDAYT